ncbi:MAG: diguanylate cyclase domain-containing protein [Gammaproteobacteria bacterium]
MDEFFKAFLEGSGISVFVYFVIRGLRREISALNETVRQQNQIFDAMSKRISETEKMAESYKKWWEELQESYDKHKAALIKSKNEYILELEQAIEQKDEKLQAKARAELDMIAMQENIIEDLQRQAGDTERQLTEMRERAKQLAECDPLTGLKNRISIEQTVIKLIRENRSFSVLFLDLDKFKTLNDMYGHSVGDETLVKVSKRISRIAGSDRLVGRVGGDEFVVVDKSENAERTLSFATELLTEIAKPISLSDGREISLTSSIGISRFPEHANGARRLMAQADIALYAAKSEGAGRYKEWDNKLNVSEAKTP